MLISILIDAQELSTLQLQQLSGRYIPTSKNFSTKSELTLTSHWGQNQIREAKGCYFEVSTMKPSISISTDWPQRTNPTQLVTIFVDDEETGPKFIVHKDFACHYSPVFKAAFHSQLIEGVTQTYILQDTTPAAIRLLVHWLYTQKVHLPVAEEDREDVSDRDRSIWLAELWVLGDKLLVPRLQNEVLSSMLRLKVQRLNLLLSLGTIKYIYSHTSSGSQLRRFVVHLCIYCRKAACYEDPSRFSYFPKEMLAEALLLAIENMRDPAKKSFLRDVRYLDASRFFVRE